MIPVTILTGILALYLLKVALFLLGSKRASKPQRSVATPSVSVILAARNEEANIHRCLRSLSALVYEGDLEILIVNDQSTDATPVIMTEWAAKDSRIRMISTEGQVHGLKGKTNAIAQAIERSTGEIILTTDADCEVPRDWVQRTVEQYDAHTGCVCGFTMITTDGWFSGMQSLDWAYLLTVASAGVGWNRALSAVGNNMSYRRAVYDEVGGYQGVGFSVTEDFALLMAIAYKTSWKVRYAAEPSTLVWSAPCPNVQDLYRQKKRWGNGGLDSPLTGFIVMSVGFLMNLALLLLPLFGLPLWAWFAGFAGKCMGDAVLLAWPLSRFRRMDLFRYFLHFELYYIVYVTALPFVVLLGGKVVWKDRKL
ncbi:MAG: glycosyltransferase [Bacteroidia bacterium]|nr:glycosyltransferase [Bacteroidia bacterium]